MYISRLKLEERLYAKTCVIKLEWIADRDGVEMKIICRLLSFWKSIDELSKVDMT